MKLIWILAACLTVTCASSHAVKASLRAKKTSHHAVKASLRAKKTSPPCHCSMDWNPVCLRGDFQPQTVSNAECAEKCYGVSKYTPGECEEEKASRLRSKKEVHFNFDEMFYPHEKSSKKTKRTSMPCFCTQNYFPVCGNDGSDYDNPDCAKRCASVQRYLPGSCAHACGACVDEPYNPVCGPDNIPYKNECTAVQCFAVPGNLLKEAESPSCL